MHICYKEGHTEKIHGVVPGLGCYVAAYANGDWVPKSQSLGLISNAINTHNALIK
jgi:hypothetical protein